MTRQDDYQEAYDNYKANTKEEERFFCGDELADMAELFEMWVILSAFRQLERSETYTWRGNKSLWNLCSYLCEAEASHQADLVTAQQEARDIDG
jgi:hypothetical protein